jgi:uncharacterized repeat protein (TIGR03803 family)
MKAEKVGRFVLSIYAGAALAGCGLPQLSSSNAPLVPGAVDTRSREGVLRSFLGASDGSSPSGNLLADSAGNLYGTTSLGGMSSSCYTYVGGCGTVFELVRAHGRYRERVLHMFSGGSDGEHPGAALVGDGTGAIYGTTSGGGTSNNGTVFKIVGGKEHVVWSFKGGRKDGCHPSGNLIVENATLYGTTEDGGVGATDLCILNTSGNGTVFSLTSAGAERVIYGFQTGGDGQHPHGGLLADANGALYGTTVYGGTYNVGTVFKLTPSGSAYRETYRYSFKGANGALPNAGLIADASGALYGTTAWGGDGHCYYGTGFGEGCGVVFKLTPRRSGYTETTLYSFQGFGDGNGPYGDLLAGANGALYGTTRYGGAKGKGTVFALTPHGKKYVERVLWSFGAFGDGRYPVAGLITDSGGALYGTTTSGGTFGYYGTVFEVRP